MKRKVRIKVKNRTKFVTAILIMTLMVFSSVFMIAGNIQAGLYSDMFNKYYVKNNDTIWDIAVSITPENMDVRKVMYDIQEMNDLTKNPEIYPGQVLNLPVY